MPDGGLYCVEFFEIQLRFAAKVAEVVGISLAQAVGNYTNIYVRLGMGSRFSQANPEWQRFVTELTETRDQAKYTYAVHRGRIHLPRGPSHEQAVGCFSYALAEPGSVRLHFNSGNHALESPLSRKNQPARQAELATLLSHLKAAAGENIHIVGASWLYNLDCYRSLFPAPFLSSLRIAEHPYQRMPLWGQFLKRDRSVRSQVGACFLESVTRATNQVELAACFPFSVLATKAPARLLYDHAGESSACLPP